MIYSVDFKEIVGKINPLELCKYLRDLDWQEFCLSNNFKNVKIFQFIKETELIQIKVPMSRELVDFKATMLETCKEIAKVNNKSLEQTILELLNPLSDIIRIRIENENIINGSILFEDALKLYDNAKKLITSTAITLYSKQDDFHGKISENVQSFIDNCRYGQTEIGSYVVSVVCPFIKNTKDGAVQLSIYSEEEECATSITRQVTKKLITDLKNVKKIIDDGKDLDILIKSNTEDKININFLDALKNLNIQQPNTKLDIITKWAPTISDNAVPDAQVSFDHDYYEVLRSKVERYRAIKNEGKVEILGQIRGNSAAIIPEDRKYGIVHVVALLNGKTKNIKVQLQKDYYYAAMTAHKNGSYVKISGEYANNEKNLLICDVYEDISDDKFI